MAVSYAQIRYYDKSTIYENGSKVSDKQTLTNVLEKYHQLKKIGIQGPSGIKFSFTKSNANPLMIGANGIFELDLDEDDNTVINTLFFNDQSLENIDNNSSAWLLIDLCYQKEGNE